MPLNERQKGPRWGEGREGEREGEGGGEEGRGREEGNGRSRRRENHNQDILFGKYIFSTKEKHFKKENASPYPEVTAITFSTLNLK